MIKPLSVQAVAGTVIWWRTVSAPFVIHSGGVIVHVTENRTKGAPVAQANSVLVSTSGPAHVANSMVTHDDRVGFSGLKEDEWHTLMQMLNERKTGASNANSEAKHWYVFH